MPKRLGTPRSSGRSSSYANLSPSALRQNRQKERLKYATAVLWLVAGISIGSFTTRILDRAHSSITHGKIDIDIAIDTANALMGTGATATAKATANLGGTKAEAATNPQQQPPVAKAGTATVARGLQQQQEQKQQQQQQQTSTRRPQYYEIEAAINAQMHVLDKIQRFQFSDSSYNRATVVHDAPWIPKIGLEGSTNRRLCRQTCCVEPVAVSLAQDAQQLIHCRDGFDLADVMIAHAPNGMNRAPHLKFPAAYLNEAILPCLVPGTIIEIDNHVASIAYFWQKIRPQIKVPFVLITSGSDGDTPQIKPQHIIDPLMLQWYGNNPNVEPHRANPQFMQGVNGDKFRPMHLGLSGFNHPQQEQHILPYLQLTNFTNPFINMQQQQGRFDFKVNPFTEFDKEVFVHFGKNGEPRKNLWKTLCADNQNNKGGASCSRDTMHMSVSKIYSDMSKYRFGVSPPGVGWDCYRTYEMLLLGIIPIIDDKGPVNRKLFEGLPVVFMHKLSSGAQRKQDFVQAIQEYIASDAFQKADFSEGWNHLFMKYNRQRLLKDTGRDKEILVDEQGNQYYQSYKYTMMVNGEPQAPKRFFCEEPTSCLSDEEQRAVPDYIQKKEDWFTKPAAPLEGEDKQFVDLWQARKVGN